MTFSHANCTHPATGRDRAICRKASNNSGPQAQAFPGGSRPSKNEAAQAFRDRIKASRAARERIGVPAMTIAEMRADQENKPETNPGCKHGLRFAPGGCSACSR